MTRKTHNAWMVLAALCIACSAPAPSPVATSMPDAGAPPSASPTPPNVDAGTMAPPAADPPAPEAPPFVPATARLRRLLGYQYQNAIADLLGEEAAAVVVPPADGLLNGFAAIANASLALAPADVERYEANAFAAAAVAIQSSEALPFRLCTPIVPDDLACAQQIVALWGRQVYRRQLTEDEVSRWSSVVIEGAQRLGDFDAGLEFMLAGMLQSPNFLYMSEVGTPVPNLPGRQRLTGYEIATRLSFFLLGTTPSIALLDAAAQGALDTSEGLRVYATELLQDPRARRALHAYFEETWGLAALAEINRPGLGYSESIAASMREETLRLIDEIVWNQNADARTLFSADYTFVNSELSAFYDMPEIGGGNQWVQVFHDSASERKGILTQGAFLARFAHPDRSSPTLRGKYIREHLFCQAVPAPPNDVDTTLPEPTEEDIPQTTRDRLSAHVENTSCAGCHYLMDPLGFPLERFDQVGRFRETEYGLAIRTDSEIDGQQVENAQALGDWLAVHPDVPDCMVRNLYRHAVGHVEEVGETASILLVQNAFENSGYRLQDVLIEIVSSEAFRFVSQPAGVAP